MDETQKPAGDATPKGQDSQQQPGSNSEPRTYTEAELKKATEDAIAQYGDRVKREKIDPIVKERDALKERVGNVDLTIQDYQATIDSLNEQIAELSKDDPEKSGLIKARRDLEGQKRELQKERTDWQKQRAEWEPEINDARVNKRNKFITDIVKNYEGGDAQKLTQYADDMGLTFNDTDKIQKGADYLFPKKAAPPPVPPLRVVPGSTTGGSDGIPTDPMEFRQWIANMSQHEYETKWKPILDERRNQQKA